MAEAQLPDAPLADPQPAAALAEAFRRVGFDAAAFGAVVDGGEDDRPAVYEA